MAPKYTFSSLHHLCREENKPCREENKWCREENKWCGEENKWCGEENKWCREENKWCREEKVYFGATVARRARKAVAWGGGGGGGLNLYLDPCECRRVNEMGPFFFFFFFKSNLDDLGEYHE